MPVLAYDPQRLDAIGDVSSGPRCVMEECREHLIAAAAKIGVAGATAHNPDLEGLAADLREAVEAADKAAHDAIAAADRVLAAGRVAHEIMVLIEDDGVNEDNGGE